MSEVDNNYGVSHGLDMIYITLPPPRNLNQTPLTVRASEPDFRMIFIEQLLIVFSN